MLAVSDLMEKRLSSDTALQDSLQKLVSDAVVAQTRTSNFIPLLMKGGGLPTGGTGTSSGGSSGTSPALPSIPAGTYIWGIQWYVSEDGMKAIGTGLAIEGGVVAAVVAACAPLPFPFSVFVAALAAFIGAEYAIMKAVDKGKGVYVNMSWFAPGIFVPTSA